MGEKVIVDYDVLKRQTGKLRGQRDEANRRKLLYQLALIAIVTEVGKNNCIDAGDLKRLDIYKTLGMETPV